MRTIKVKILGVLVMMLLSATVSFGQSVYYDASKGGVVIDCTMMPESSVLAKSMEGTNTGKQLIAHNATDEANTVYPLLVVATEDLSDNNFSALNWDTAVDAAKSKSKTINNIKFNDWRIPNQRELLLIWVLRDKIAAAAAAANVTAYNNFASKYYWSSTIDANTGGDYYFCVSFELGYTAGLTDGKDKDKDDKYARAVREIPLP